MQRGVHGGRIEGWNIVIYLLPAFCLSKGNHYLSGKSSVVHTRTCVQREVGQHPAALFLRLSEEQEEEETKR